MTLGNRNVVQSLVAYWGANFSGDYETVYPGMQVDANSWQQWVELQVPVLREERHSHSGLATLRFSLDVHCFARRDTDLKRIHALVDDVRKVWTRIVCPVRNYDESALPAIGLARLGEAEVRDLSRIEQRVLGGTLNHWLVSYRGLAQMTEGDA